MWFRSRLIMVKRIGGKALAKRLIERIAQGFLAVTSFSDSPRVRLA